MLVIGCICSPVVREAAAQFAPPVHYPTVPDSWAVKIGDLNADGIPDLAVGNYTSESYSILLGNGDGTFAPAVTYYTGFVRPTAVEILDVNADGNQDLVMAGLGVYGFYGNGDGTFSEPDDVATPAYQLDPGFSLAYDDTTGELVVSSRQRGVCYWLRRYSPTSMLTWGAASLVAAQYPEAVAAWSAPGSCCGYSRDWIIAAPGSTTDNVEVMLASQGAGGPPPMEVHATGIRPLGIAAGDLNCDGRQDLAVANNGSNDVSILLSTGDWHFAPAVNYPAGGSPYKVLVHDVNGDSKPDLVLTNNSASGTVSVLLGAGDGTFATPISLGVVAWPTGLDMGDLNGDGRADLVVTNGSSGVTVFLNNQVPNCRFANSVTHFSSEGSPTAGSAQQALGPPDVYPGHGHSPLAWSGATPDGQQEYLELGFADPAPINFVNVYETNAPGAITSVQVKNPGTGLFEVVWSRAVAAASPVSRLFTATFPVTMFPVSEIRIELFSPLVPGFNEVDAVSVGYRDREATSQWASGVVDFSSEFGAQYSAVSALGPPNVYPAYGDLGETWASLTPDDHPEYLELSYSTPQPINYVSVYETYAPGALDKVWVMNPNTGLYEIVWSGTAAPAPPLSRINTVSFPETRFPVSQVRLDFNSPAVPDWNEVDAVGVGRCACQASIVDVPAPDAPAAANAIRMVRPNPFRESTEIEFTLPREGRARVEVFDLQGKRVAQVLDRTLPAGRHGARWDGRDATGRTVASGIYHVRVESAGVQAARRVVKID